MGSADRRPARLEVCLAGAGGQGLILIGIVLAEAAGVHEGRRVVQTQTYGPESRGGRCRSDVIIADGEIDFPEVDHPDVLLVLSQEAATAYVPTLRPGGTLIFDSGLVKQIPSVKARTYSLPFTELARERLGRVLFANIIAIGAVAAITHLVSTDALREAVLARAPRGTEEPNRQALEIGLEVGSAAKASGSAAPAAAASQDRGDREL